MTTTKLASRITSRNIWNNMQHHIFTANFFSVYHMNLKTRLLYTNSSRRKGIWDKWKLIWWIINCLNKYWNWNQKIVSNRRCNLWRWFSRYRRWRMTNIFWNRFKIKKSCSLQNSKPQQSCYRQLERQRWQITLLMCRLRLWRHPIFT